MNVLWVYYKVVPTALLIVHKNESEILCCKVYTIHKSNNNYYH